MISNAEKAASLFWRTSVFALSSQVSTSPIWALKSVCMYFAFASCCCILLSDPVWSFSDRFCMFFSSILRTLPDSRIQYIVKQICHQIAHNDQNSSKNNRAL